MTECRTTADLSVMENSTRRSGWPSLVRLSAIGTSAVPLDDHAAVVDSLRDQVLPYRVGTFWLSLLLKVSLPVAVAWLDTAP